MLHKDYYRKGSVEKISDRESQGARRQDELIGGKVPVVTWLRLWPSPQFNNIGMSGQDVLKIVRRETVGIIP
jgi:hypothetical protein